MAQLGVIGAHQAVGGGDGHDRNPGQDGPQRHQGMADGIARKDHQGAVGPKAGSQQVMRDACRAGKKQDVEKMRQRKAAEAGQKGPVAMRRGLRDQHLAKGCRVVAERDGGAQDHGPVVAPF